MWSSALFGIKRVASSRLPASGLKFALHLHYCLFCILSHCDQYLSCLCCGLVEWSEFIVMLRKSNCSMFFTSLEMKAALRKSLIPYSATRLYRLLKAWTPAMLVRVQSSYPTLDALNRTSEGQEKPAALQQHQQQAWFQKVYTPDCTAGPGPQGPRGSDDRSQLSFLDFLLMRSRVKG